MGTPMKTTVCVFAFASVLLAAAVGAATLESVAERIERIEARDQQQAQEAERLLKRTGVFDGPAFHDPTPRATTLLDEWRKEGTVEGRDVSLAPGPQAPISTATVQRIVGVYSRDKDAKLLKPFEYLDSGQFDLILVRVEAMWNPAWYGELLRGVNGRRVLVLFDHPLGEPDFDGIKEFLDAYRTKIWAIVPGAAEVSNIDVWDAFSSATLRMEIRPKIDPEYRQTTAHLWAVTNFVNSRCPEIPICVLFSENRYTNEAFARAVGFTPSAFLLRSVVPYEWGTGKVTPPLYWDYTWFGKSGMEAIRQVAPCTPVIFEGQVARLHDTGLPLSRADAVLAAELDGFFQDAASKGYAGACLRVR